MKKNGFTLLETLAVVAMSGILASAAYSSYSHHLNKKDEAIATKFMYEAAQKLENHRGNNFTYAGYPDSEIVSPEGATGDDIKYRITIYDASGNNPLISADTAKGRDYVVRAISTSEKRFSLLYTSRGQRCKTKTSSRITFKDCGTVYSGSRDW